MGAFSSRDFKIIVKTGDCKGAGTDSNIRCVLYDETGAKSRSIHLDCLWKDDFERGNIDTFNVRNVKNLGTIIAMEISRDTKGFKDDWFLEYIIVKQHTKVGSTLKDMFLEDKEFAFPIHRWISGKKKYVFYVYDSILPQFDKRVNQRSQELQEKRKFYRFCEDCLGLPRQIEELPPEEQFSNEYMWDIVSRKMHLIVQKKWNSLITTKRLQSFEDFLPLFKGTFGTPYGYTIDWKSDKEFGAQRLRGCNPVLISLCTSIPENFAVTSEMVEPFLGGKSLSKAIDKKEIYIIDLKDIEGISVPSGRTMTRPIALFHEKPNGDLMPIAIQLFQQPAENNPVFLPSDPPLKWLLVKMYYNNADVVVHQACTHLGFTHIFMESVCITMHRELSPSHPLFRLMAPHFIYLIAINWRGGKKLTARNGWIDVTMTPGIDGTFELISKKWKKWRLDRDGWLPGNLQARGVDDTAHLSKYYYRDDALLLNEAITNYVTDVVQDIYDEPHKLTADYELQEFARLLVDEKEGAGIKGVFGRGKFTNMDDLIKFISTVIFLSSAQHAAVNFTQYDEYAFTPFYPGSLRGEPPRNKEEITEKDILNQLPEKSMILDIMVVTNLLSEQATRRLGDFEIQYQYEPSKLEAVARFQKALRRVSDTIKERNEKRERPYDCLDPDGVPNAISI